MGNSWLAIFLIAVMFLGIIGIIGTYITGNKQQNVKDDEPGARVMKHPVLANPIFITFMLFPVVLVAGSLLFYFFIYLR